MTAVAFQRAFAPVALFFALLTFAITPAHADLTDADADKAYAFITELGGEAISSLTEDGISNEEREERFASLFETNFNGELISRFVLGRFWRTASAEERSEFRSLFDKYVVAAYANRFKDYGGEKFVVTKASVNKRDLWVDSEIQRLEAGAPAIRIRWRVRPVKDKPDELRIIDVVVEGLSMSITRRDEFASVIQSSGGKVSALNALLKERVGE